MHAFFPPPRLYSTDCLPGCTVGVLPRPRRAWHDVRRLPEGSWRTAKEFINVAPALHAIVTAVADGTRISSSLSEQTGVAENGKPGMRMRMRDGPAIYYKFNLKYYF